MAVYRKKGCKTYTMDFRFAGQRILEPTGTRSKTLAKKIEDMRRRGLEAGAAGVRKPERPRIFSVAADEWLEAMRPAVAASTLRIYKTDLAHLKPVFGGMLVCDIEAKDVLAYQKARLGENSKPDKDGPKPKTVNLEVGTLRAILKRAGAWARIQPHVKMLPVRDDIGRAISAQEEAALLAACASSRSRSLHTFVTLALATGVRYGVIRTLTWAQIDLERGLVRWGKDKTAAGTGNTVPLSQRALAALKFWAAQFPKRQPEHFVFPLERYGGAGRKGPQGTRQDAAFSGGKAYATDLTKPVGDIKEAWKAAKKRAKVACRFHDLRHTACSRTLAAGRPLPVVSKLFGWSAGTAVRMALRYGHFSEAELRKAIEATSLPGTPTVAQELTQGPADFHADSAAAGQVEIRN